MKLLGLALVALVALSAGRLVAAEYDATLRDPTAQMQLVIDRGALQAGAKSAKMTSLWWDAAAAPSLTHIAKQLDLLLLGKPAPIGDLIARLNLVNLAIHAPTADDPDPRLARFALITRHDRVGRADSASDLAAAISARIERAVAGAVGPFQGSGNGQWFAGAVGAALAFGDAKAIARYAEKGESSATLSSKHPAWMTCDLAPTLELVKVLDADGITYGLDPLLPKWREQTPRLTLIAAPKGDEWIGTIDFAATDVPVHAIDPALGALAVTGRHVRIAAGLEPALVTGLLSNLLSVRTDRELTQLLGMSPGEAAALFTGDVLLMVDASGILPQGALVLAMKPGSDAGPLLSNVANAFQGQKADVPGATSAYLLDTRLGPWGIAVGKGRLVLGNDPDLGQQLLAGTAGDAPIPAGKALVVDIDLPLIAKQWLPLAYQLLSKARLEFGPDPLRNVQFQLPDAMLALHQSVGGQAKASQLLAPPEGMTITRQGATLPWGGLAKDFQAQLQPLIGADDAAKALDARFSLFGETSQTPPEISATVFRAADGFHICEDDRRGRTRALSAQQLTDRLGGMKRLMGPDPAQLVAISVPARPVLDSRWLPDAAVVQRHLPMYHLEATVSPTGIIAQERGITLGVLSCAGGLLYLGLLQQPRMLQYHALAGDGQGPKKPNKGLVDF
ncbi:MAG: hypothetical protein H0V44_18895 [Planctomycetes bacterium]|nr:hypothetical protein [Planctomycetota bacterium]